MYNTIYLIMKIHLLKILHQKNKFHVILYHYGNEFIEKILSKEQVARNSLSVIDASINEKIILRQNFDMSEDGKILNSLKNARRNDITLIINVIDWTNNREIVIDELSRKRDIFSNGVNRIRKHKNNLKCILKDCRYNRNKIDRGFEDKVKSLLHKFDIKREVFLVVW